MNDKATVFSSRPFLGCYHLQEQFFDLAENCQTAIYRYEENTLNIACSPVKTEVQELVKGKLLKQTSRADFQQAVFHHFSKYDSLKDKVFLSWMRKLEGLPGVYVEPFTIGRKGYLFFPAVFLFYLRMPVTTFNYAKLSKAIWYNGLQKRVHHRYRTALFKRIKSAAWVKEEIELVEFSLAWHEVYPVCELLITAGLTDPECRIPIMVQEYNNGTACKGIQFYNQMGESGKVLFKDKERE